MLKKNHILIGRAEIANRLDEDKVTVGVGGWTNKTFVGIHTDGTYIKATANHVAVVGVAKDTLTAATTGYFKNHGLGSVLADCPLAARDYIKVGSGGRASKWNSAVVSLDAECTGTATSFTQPAGAGVLKIAQAADVAADRGRGITIVGSNAAGAVIFETIYLDDADSSTVVAGTTATFTKVSGAFTADGAVLGAQDVHILRADGVTGIVDIAGAASMVGAEIPNATQEAYCSLVKHTNAANAVDVTFITWYGYDDANVLTGERVQLADGGVGAKAVATSTKKFKKLLRICTGEFTNASTAATATSAADDANLKVGRNTAAVVAEGDTAVVFLKPNA